VDRVTFVTQQPLSSLSWRLGPPRATGGIWRSFAAALVLFAGCATDRNFVPRSSFPHQPAIGLCEDYPEESRTLAEAREDLQRTRESGGAVLRIAFGWDAMEPEPGAYDWSFWDDFVRMAVDEFGIRLIPYICYTPAWAASEAGDDIFWRSPPRDPAAFERFMAAISARYARWIDSWELWNEPDNPAYWTGDVEQFAELVRAGTQGVRRGDPSAKIVLGGVAWNLEFVRELFAEHDIAPLVDIVNVHSYFETWHEHAIEQLPQYLDDAAEIIREHGEQEPLWMAEVGYSSQATIPNVSEVYRAHYPSEHTPSYQASALARTMLLSLGTGHLSVFAWYRINDLPNTQEVIGDANNLSLGLFDTAGKPKPAHGTFRWLTKHLSQPHRPAAESVSVTVEPAQRVETRTFALANGQWLVAAWLPPPEQKADGPAIADPREGVVTVRLSRANARVVETHYAPERSPSVQARTTSTANQRSTTLRLELKRDEVGMVVLE
jgi:polysaccharide biosynthesis protein PslG